MSFNKKDPVCLNICNPCTIFISSKVSYANFLIHTFFGTPCRISIFCQLNFQICRYLGLYCSSFWICLLHICWILYCWRSFGNYQSWLGILLWLLEQSWHCCSCTLCPQYLPQLVHYLCGILSIRNLTQGIYILKHL